MKWLIADDVDNGYVEVLNADHIVELEIVGGINPESYMIGVYMDTKNSVYLTGDITLRRAKKLLSIIEEQLVDDDCELISMRRIKQVLNKEVRV